MFDVDQLDRVFDIKGMETMLFPLRLLLRIPVAMV